jgi:hypothetical protein
MASGDLEIRTAAGGPRPLAGILAIATLFAVPALAPLVGSFLGLLSGAEPAAAAPAPDPAPAELQARALEAFERYARLTEGRNEDELRAKSSFLWVDSLPETQREQAYAQLRAGKVQIERLETREQGKAIECPDGLIHHWVGVIYIPGATLEQTLRLVQDYDHHATYYKPEVQRAKILEHHGDDFRVFLRFQRKKVLTVVLNTEHEIHYFPLGATRAHSRSRTTRISEVENHDTPGEREKPVGRDGGYLWRMDTWWRFLERDGGTYVQCESVSLTRSIPAGLGWLVGRFVNSIPRESLTFTLTATRAALEHSAAKQ